MSDLVAWCQNNISKFKHNPDKQEGVGVCLLHPDTDPSLWIGFKNQAGRFECRACKAQGTLIEYADLTGLPTLRKTYASSGLGQVTAEYVYTNLAGKPLLKVKRYEKDGQKTFRQFKSAGTDWVGGGVNPSPLYHAPNLVAAKPGEDCYIVEGEKAAQCGIDNKILCTTAPQGASKFDKVGQEYIGALKHLNIFILPDNDEVGFAHANQVFKILSAAGISSKIIVLPGLKPKGDLYDWLATNKPYQLTEIAYDEKNIKEAADAAKVYAQTDLGNAEMFLALHGKNVRWIEEANQWLIWNGTNWNLDSTGSAKELANNTARLRRERAELLEDGKLVNAEIKWAEKSESTKHRNAMLEQVKAFPEYCIDNKILDIHPWLLNCANGTLDLETGKLNPPKRSDFLTKKLNASYDPKAKCPIWEKYLHRSMDGNEENINFLRRLVGYSLTGSIRDSVMIVCWGHGLNGKTIFLETIAALLGEYGATARAEMLEAKKGGNNSSSNANPEIAMLRAARFVSISEATQGARLDESLVKQITGGDQVLARFNYGNFFSFLPKFKLWLATNYKPEIIGTDHGIWRRIVLVPWGVQIPPGEIDRDLGCKLKEELQGILTWAIVGFHDWFKHGLNIPQGIQAAISDYRSESDVIGNFLGEYCLLGEEFSVTSKALYGAFHAYMIESGEYFKPSQKSFALKLKARGFSQTLLGRARLKGWKGIKLSHSEDNTDPIPEHPGVLAELDGLI